jgi:hypothetical protein
MPTLFDLLGLSELPHADGRSRLPEILAAAGRSELSDRTPTIEPGFALLDRSWGKAEKPPDPIIALTLPDRRYIRRLDPDEGGQEILDPDVRRSSLYETDVDPGETVDLLKDGVGVIDTTDFEAAIAELLARPGPPWLDDVGRVELSDLQKGQLKAIGYAVED